MRSCTYLCMRMCLYAFEIIHIQYKFSVVDVAVESLAVLFRLFAIQCDERNHIIIIVSQITISPIATA